MRILPKVKWISQRAVLNNSIILGFWCLYVEVDDYYGDSLAHITEKEGGFFYDIYGFYRHAMCDGIESTLGRAKKEVEKRLIKRHMIDSEMQIIPKLVWGDSSGENCWLWIDYIPSDNSIASVILEEGEVEFEWNIWDGNGDCVKSGEVFYLDDGKKIVEEELRKMGVIA